MADLQKRLNDLGEENNLVTLRPRKGSALTTKFQQILYLTRKKARIVHDIGVLQAEYFFHLPYEDTTECLEMTVPGDISPSEVQIFQAGATSMIHDKSLSRARRDTAKCFHEKLEELKTTAIANHSVTEEDPVLEQLHRSIEESKKA